MGKELDLNDVAGTSSLAMFELAAMRLEIARLREENERLKAERNAAWQDRSVSEAAEGKYKMAAHRLARWRDLCLDKIAKMQSDWDSDTMKLVKVWHKAKDERDALAARADRLAEALMGLIQGKAESLFEVHVCTRSPSMATHRKNVAKSDALWLAAREALREWGEGR